MATWAYATSEEKPLYLFEDNLIHSLLARGPAVGEEMEGILSTGVSEAFLPVVLWQIQSGGKRLRPCLTLLFAEALGNPEPAAALAAACGIELIHNYSLIFDDIMDHGTIRRNRTTVRVAYGDHLAILAGLQHREAVTECARRTGRHATAVEQVYSATIRRMIEGQRLDLFFGQNGTRDHNSCLQNWIRRNSFGDYLEMVRGKTAALIGAACELGVLVAGGGAILQKAARAYGENLGVALQILDDYLDIFADPLLGAFGKEPYKDVKERKLGNYVILKACAALPPDEGSELVSLLRGPVCCQGDDTLRRCIALIEKADVKKSIRYDARRWTENAKKALAGRFKGPAGDSLRRVADILAERTF